MYYYREAKTGNVLHIGLCGCCADIGPLDPQLWDELPDQETDPRFTLLIQAESPEALKSWVESEYAEALPWISELEIVAREPRNNADQVIGDKIQELFSR